MSPLGNSDLRLLKGECINNFMKQRGHSVEVIDIREKRMQSDIDEITERIKRRSLYREIKEERTEDNYRDV